MSEISRTKDRFVCPRPNPGAEFRLFLFPYAGGGPAVFNKWPSGLPGTVEVWIAHYPGRGSRHSEPPVKRVRALAETLAQAIGPLLKVPFAFFGHSLGGLVAFELTRQLHQQTHALPQILYVSACGAPGTPDPHPLIHALPDPEFIQSLQELNGLPAEVTGLPELVELMLPTLRADFEAVETYEFAPGEFAASCPIVALGGKDDPRVSRDRLDGWASLTRAGFKSIYYPGDHFFINTSREAILASLSEELISFHEKH